MLDPAVAAFEASSSARKANNQDRARKAVADAFLMAGWFLRSTARTRDWFVGYSTAEVVADRIRAIGKDDTSTTELHGRQLTQLSRLNAFEQQVTAAVDAALLLDATTPTPVDDETAE